MITASKQFFQIRFQRWLQRRVPPQRAIHLTQRNIFIFPSKAGLNFCALLFLLLVVAINYQNNMAFALTFLLASMFVVAILHTYLNLSGLNVDIVKSFDAFAGEHVEMQLRFSTKEGRGHQGVTCGFDNEGFIDFSCENGKEVRESLFVKAKHRGRFQPPRLRVESFYPLGLLRAWSRPALETEVLVYPEPIEQVLRLPDKSGAEGEADSAFVAGSDDFYGFKDYQIGDSLKHVHWQSYAKGQPLQTKEFSGFSGKEQVLDWNYFDGDQEARLSALCFWVIEFSRLQHYFSVRLPGTVYGPDSGEHYREQLLRVLALYGDSGSSHGS